MKQETTATAGLRQRADVLVSERNTVSQRLWREQKGASSLRGYNATPCPLNIGMCMAQYRYGVRAVGSRTTWVQPEVGVGGLKPPTATMEKVKSLQLLHMDYYRMRVKLT